MKVLISFLGTLVVISLLVCAVGWIFVTDFMFFDILLMIAIIALQIVIPLVILIIIIWVILEIFR